jgi:hypothetical protein
MNLRLFQELMDLNLAFEQVIHGLQRLEKVRLFNGEIIRYARADVESARVDANREFFDNFDDIVESDAVWAYKFQRLQQEDQRSPLPLESRFSFWTLGLFPYAADMG